MARTLGSRVVALAWVLGCWAGAAQSSAAQVQLGPITVLVYNRAHMRQQTLRDGEEVGKAIFAKAGMASVWLDCFSESGESVQQCNNPQVEIKLVLTVIKRWKGSFSDENRLGLAVQNPPGFGIYCYVFEEKLDELVRDTHVTPSRLLGSAIAHEIGHLLKGSNSHSARGIMSAYWYRDEIEAARRGALAFTPEDIAAIRARFAIASESPATRPLAKPKT